MSLNSIAISACMIYENIRFLMVSRLFSARLFTKLSHEQSLWSYCRITYAIQSAG